MFLEDVGHRDKWSAALIAPSRRKASVTSGPQRRPPFDLRSHAQSDRSEPAFGNPRNRRVTAVSDGLITG